MSLGFEMILLIKDQSEGIWTREQELGMYEVCIGRAP
jgi:hypothetical protein